MKTEKVEQKGAGILSKIIGDIFANAIATVVVESVKAGISGFAEEEKEKKK